MSKTRLNFIDLMRGMAMAWNYLKTKYEYFGRIAVFTMIAAGAVIFILI